MDKERVILQSYCPVEWLLQEYGRHSFSSPRKKRACHLLNTFILSCMGLCGSCWLSKLNLQQIILEIPFIIIIFWEKLARWIKSESQLLQQLTFFFIYIIGMFYLGDYVLKLYWLYICISLLNKLSHVQYSLANSFSIFYWEFWEWIFSSFLNPKLVS